MAMDQFTGLEKRPYEDGRDIRSTYKSLRLNQKSIREPPCW